MDTQFGKFPLSTQQISHRWYYQIIYMMFLLKNIYSHILFYFTYHHGLFAHHAYQRHLQKFLIKGRCIKKQQG